MDFRYALSNDIKTFEISKNVGGRFSVFSAVGLLPLAIVGIDIDEILLGIKNVHDDFFAKKDSYERLLRKARFFTEYKNSFNINVVFSYSSRLEGFNKWYIQLWGESLGKYQRHSAFNVGLTPIGLIGPKDQHSFLQLIMEGTRDKSVTFIKIEDFHDNISIPDITLAHLESLDTLNNLSFSKLINMQCDSVIEALEDQGDIPLDTITIQSVTEANIGSLIFYYELLTSLVGELIDVNTYDQPGVEAGKIILKKKLGA